MLKNKILWKGGMQKILKKQAHLNKVLKAVLNTNQLIGKESDPACLIQKRPIQPELNPILQVTKITIKKF
ncbi:hypothetical protein [Desulfobacter postgatei]|uniref:hypothetical protein n=1 Tax=Desulfobacter postgatei TaxID=2293 RepID=UPI00259B5954|nr:hypothetical protein [uncultured Desulfobacter sp.]